ncbi:MAG: hypothetical protein MUP18_00765, partial [Desulfobacterales bacterium]|nr:hypothetical protein [Desulfobacterales bacterium]
EESDTKCHPERSEGSAELLRFAQYKLHGVYPEPKSETLPLRFTQGQGDTWRRVQNDKHGISLIVTQSLMGVDFGVSSVERLRWGWTWHVLPHPALSSPSQRLFRAGGHQGRGGVLGLFSK